LSVAQLLGFLQSNEMLPCQCITPLQCALFSSLKTSGLLICHECIYFNHMQVHCDARLFEAVIEQKLEALPTKNNSSSAMALEWANIHQGVRLRTSACAARPSHFFHCSSMYDLSCTPLLRSSVHQKAGRATDNAKMPEHVFQVPARTGWCCTPQLTIWVWWKGQHLKFPHFWQLLQRVQPRCTPQLRPRSASLHCFLIPRNRKLLGCSNKPSSALFSTVEPLNIVVAGHVFGRANVVC
jgi:hypothetical protein